jgi:hypothetical protein
VFLVPAAALRLLAIDAGGGEPLYREFDLIEGDCFELAPATTELPAVGDGGPLTIDSTNLMTENGERYSVRLAECDGRHAGRIVDQVAAEGRDTPYSGFDTLLPQAKRSCDEAGVRLGSDEGLAYWVAGRTDW